MQIRLLNKSQGFNAGRIHGQAMYLVWFIASNLGLWVQLFKHKKWANIMHFFFMSIVVLITWMSGFLAIITFWYHAYEKMTFHLVLGISIMILVLLQAILGITSWILQRNSRTNPYLIYQFSFVHKILGWIMFAMTVYQILDGTRVYLFKVYNAQIVIAIFSYGGFILFKIFKKKMQSQIQVKAQDIQNLQQITNINDFAKYRPQYFIFADKVYDLSNVITHHPGGYELINRIRGREVDRFLYGTEPLQSVDKMKVHSHSAKSIELAGKPLGILKSICPFQGMEQINDVTIERLVRPCRSNNLFAPYLVSKSNQFIFKGYEDLSQLGKYYALNISNNKTRLYSVVNFLHESNLKLMAQITDKQIHQELVQIQSPSGRSDFSINTDRIQNNARKNYTVPLLIKKYGNGQFTQKFLQGNFKDNIELSKPRGRGLSLNQMPYGKIVMFAGGTGLHPFCDLIDLIYKEFLVSQNIFTDVIIKSNPIIAKNSFLKKFNFTLYLSVQNTDDIHEITAFQLNQLSKSNIMQVFLRASHFDSFKIPYPSIEKIDMKFDYFIPNIAQQLEKISQIYVCGPYEMTKSLVKNCNTYKIPSWKFRVL